MWHPITGAELSHLLVTNRVSIAELGQRTGMARDKINKYLKYGAEWPESERLRSAIERRSANENR